MTTTTTAPAVDTTAAACPASAIAAPATRPVRTGRHRCTRPRTLHLIDLENLVGGHITTDTVTNVWTEYALVTGIRSDDHVTVAVSHRHAATAFFALPAPVQRIIGPNSPDGADHALINSVDLDWAATRFGQVMMATGDHIFTDTTAALRAVGLPVTQVIGGGTPAAALYRHCSTQLYLPTAQRQTQTRRHTTLTAAQHHPRMDR